MACAAKAPIIAPGPPGKPGIMPGIIAPAPGIMPGKGACIIGLCCGIICC